MRKSALVLGPLVVAATAALSSAAMQNPAPSSDLVVHEWGTFTSVAGQDGRPVEWKPLNGPAELPCFVSLLNPSTWKGTVNGLRAPLRMETPVLYFYSPRPATVQVGVRFPQGLITEWFPAARVTDGPWPLPQAEGTIRWADVTVRPGVRERLPFDSSGSHYYAARETDAAPIEVMGQQEKFLFYRGLAWFPVPVWATVDRGGAVTAETEPARPIRTYVLFQNRGGRMGYRIVREAAVTAKIEAPPLDGTMDALRADLEQLLTHEGLYPREAKAMVETWRDSWFEEGTRLFYLLPQSSVDRILPLEISPTPATTTRVFVGRVELVHSPAVQTDVAKAIARHDAETLAKYGRFLEPITEGTADRVDVQAALRTLTPALTSSQAVCAPKTVGR